MNYQRIVQFDEYEKLKKTVEENPLKKAKNISLNTNDESKVFKREIDSNKIYFLEDSEEEANEDEEQPETDLEEKKKEKC